MKNNTFIETFKQSATESFQWFDDSLTNIANFWDFDVQLSTILAVIFGAVVNLFYPSLAILSIVVMYVCLFKFSSDSWLLTNRYGIYDKFQGFYCYVANFDTYKTNHIFTIIMLGFTIAAITVIYEPLGVIMYCTSLFYLSAISVRTVEESSNMYFNIIRIVALICSTLLLFSFGEI